MLLSLHHDPASRTLVVSFTYAAEVTNLLINAILHSLDDVFGLLFTFGNPVACVLGNL